MDAFTAIDPLSQLTAAGLVVWCIQKLKAAGSIPWIHRQTDKLNRILAVLAALLTAAGIAWTFTPQTGTLVITGLTVANLAHVAWIALQQVVAQELIYRTAVKRLNGVSVLAAENLPRDTGPK
jgi:hypothetical protein